MTHHGEGVDESNFGTDSSIDSETSKREINTDQDLRLEVDLDGQRQLLEHYLIVIMTSG